MTNDDLTLLYFYSRLADRLAQDADKAIEWLMGVRFAAPSESVLEREANGMVDIFLGPDGATQALGVARARLRHYETLTK